MDGGFADSARIDPNAILQLVPVLDQAIGNRARQGLFVEAGVPLPPPDAGMLPEAQVIRLHQSVWFWLPTLAPDMLRQAGLATADYILANRIPALAQRVIRLMPAPLAARVLAKAIAKHAWTFAGSGQFTVEHFAPLTVSIRQNPLAPPMPVATGTPPCSRGCSAVWSGPPSRSRKPAVVRRGMRCAGSPSCGRVDTILLARLENVRQS